MTVWLVAEDRVQIIRADSVVSLTVVPVKATGTTSADPVARLPGHDRVRILAATSSARDIGAAAWSALVTLDAGGREAVKILGDLTAAIAQAEQQVARSHGGSQVMFVHGPLPRFSGNPAKDQVWHISGELPARDWPTSGSYFKDPLP